MSKLFNNPKTTVWVIVAFIIALLVLFAIPARASDLAVEGGYAIARGETPAIGLNVNWPRKGPVNTDWEVGFLLSGKSNYWRDNPNNITVYGMIVDGYKEVELGFGFAHHFSPWEYTCQDTFALMLRVRPTDRIAVQWRHFSSAGSCKPNVGRDFWTISWRF